MDRGQITTQFQLRDNNLHGVGVPGPFPADIERSDKLVVSNVPNSTDDTFTESKTNPLIYAIALMMNVVWF